MQLELDGSLQRILLQNTQGEQVPKIAAAILLQGKTKTNLDKTMDGKKLAAGNYLMSVVSEGKTASILVTIK